MALSGGNAPVVPTPERRRLHTFAFAPMSTRLSGRYLVVDVPFEASLQPGPCGSLVQVVDFDATRNQWYQPVDLDDIAILAQDGLRPMESDPRTHQQMVYAVAMSVIERFERFVGRRFRWRGEEQLRLVPHAFEGRNAFFDPERKAVLFGYYPGSAPCGATSTTPSSRRPGSTSDWRTGLLGCCHAAEPGQGLRGCGNGWSGEGHPA